MKDLQLEMGCLWDLVKDESERQIRKWGVQNVKSTEWMLYLTEEVGELAQAIGEWAYRNGDPWEVSKEAIQVATLALKIAEMFVDINRRASSQRVLHG